MSTRSALAETDFEADLELASQSYRDGNLRQAADGFARIVAADPNQHEAVRHLGLIAHRIGNHDQAAELIAQAILIKPDSGAAFADLARVLRALGRNRHALRALETAMAMGHRNAAAFADLGGLLEVLGQPEDAARARAAARELELGELVPSRWRKVQLVSIEPDGYVHAAGLADIIAAFADAFAELGIAAEVARNRASGEGVNVVFGAHLIATQAAADALPANTVLVNLEQLAGSNFQAQPIYADLLRRLSVWDHSRRNVDAIKALTGNPRVCRVGIGFVASMRKIAPAPEPTADVLFYGSLNERRRAILKALQGAGLRVRALYGVYGPERDRAIAEAKLVLNIHYYEDSIHEIVRTSHLLANRKAVVCECNADTEIDEDIRRAVIAVPYDRLVEACVALASHDARRRSVEETGFEIFRARSQAAMLADAIAATAL